LAGVEFDSVTVRMGGRTVLEDVSFRVGDSFSLGIAGPNGAGKTTLLKTLLGFVKPCRGSVRVFGLDPFRDGDKVRKLVGYVPQHERISRSIPLSVEEVILMGRLVKKGPPRSPKPEDFKAVEEALRCVGLEGFGEKLFSSLSGGQQQRVLIARALASSPRLLILDEGLTSVDVDGKFEIMEHLVRCHKTRGMNIIIVTHELTLMRRYCDVALLLNRTVHGFGHPEEVLTPEALRKTYGPSLTIVDHW